MSASVRWASAEDSADLAAIVREIAEHYREPEISAEPAELAAAEWLVASPERHFALAHVDGRAAGLACVSVAYPGDGLQRLLFVKELFVRESFRGRQVGEGLLRFLAQYCLAEGLGRIDLTTDKGNEGALRFYDRLCAARQDQKLFLRFDGDALKRLAGS